jgi:hypothetical protein
MKRNGLRILGLLLVLLLVGTVSAEEESRYPVMRPDTETWIRWQNEYLAAPRAKIDARISRMLQRAEVLEYATSMDLLGHIDYDPVQRDQGWCSNCWVWAGTGVMEIAHDVEDAVFDRLSIQYFDSCYVADWACCGGNLGDFATWYGGQSMCVPWDNTNAAFADGGRSCASGGSLVACGDIATTPDYPLTTISDVSIETHTGQATAIANIKNILNQDRAVYFGFALPDSGAWDDFFDFWNGVGGETEATLWGDTDTYCGDEWNEAPGEAGGHAVVILGYNDDDADPANHYWLALNSWGTAAGVRPNGLFRIPTQMNYDCSYPDNGTPGFWAFRFQTLDVDFGNSLPIADADGPYDEDCEGTTTTVDLDGSGSSDLEDDALDFLWTTTCPGGIFDDATSETPVLTVDTSPGCNVSCDVTVTVTDDDGAADDDTASVTISDADTPVISAPADVTVECDESTLPANTGTATATDACDPAPAVTYADVETAGACPQEKTIERTWTATDSCGNSSSAVQTIEVVDSTPSVIACNAPSFITPPQAPITFVATVTDNCDPDPTVVITGYECYKFTKKGKKIDKGESCIVEIVGDSITIHDVGGVGTFIAWDVSATDACGNGATQECEVEVVRHRPDWKW